VDGTGDAALADMCGVVCRRAGRDTEHIMPSTLMSLFALPSGVELEWGPQQECLAKALEDGFLSQEDRHFPGMYLIGDKIGNLNGGHVFGLDSLDCRSLSDGMVLGRKLAFEYLEFFRKYVPVCEEAELAATAALMGVRESRRIVGEYELNADDFMDRRHFPDQIGVFNKYMDRHAVAPTREAYEEYLAYQKRTKQGMEGTSYGIPYGVLVPRGFRNLWVAGRSVSTDADVQSSLRVMPAGSMMGQAAGTAAVQSIRTGQPACDLDTGALVTTLREAGAYLPQQKTSSSMTRG
jgi:hypothetical protein